MLSRLFRVLLTGFTALSLSGCLVAESTYIKKVDEVDSLAGQLSSLKQKHDALIVDNAALKVAYEKLKAEATGLAGETEKLTREKAELDQMLKAKSDSLSQNISDLRQKVTSLENESKKLKDDIAGLQKIRENRARDVSSTYEQLLQSLKSEIAQGQVNVSELKGKLTVSMEAAILFEPGSADVKESGRTVLFKMVDTLKSVKDRSIRIEGHTDNVAITGSTGHASPSSWDLSAARAVNVATYLQDQGVDPGMLSVSAFAEYKPPAGSSINGAGARNRRIEITVVAKD